MVDWILDPQSVRPGSHTHMPKVFGGVDGREKAEAVVAYLSTLKEAAPVVLKDPAPWALLTPPPAEGAGEEPKPLFEKLHCQSCHVLGDSTEALGDRISLKSVNRKFPPGKLVEFLRQPDLHYRFIRMPNFRLSEAEAKELAGYVSGKAEVVDEKEWKVEGDASLVQKGREWVVKGGCVKCHAGVAGGEYQAPEWGALAGDGLKRGCLAEVEAGGGGKGKESRAPVFALIESQREDLRVYLGGGNTAGSMGVNVVDEAGVRMGRVLQCVNCHGVVEGIPTLGIMGGKLRVDWMERFVGGQVPYKPRMERHPKGEPWMFARMPAFPAYAGVLAEGLAASHGYGRGVDADLGKVDEGMAKVGMQLVGKVQGFSCVSCHGAGGMPAQDVFEVEGIHLSHSAERLQRSFYRRWMRSPILVDPSTKMPGYFDEEGKSPLGDVMEGDAAKQIDAIWEYLKLGERMGVPKLAE
jgi:mono/diheme cytochrome c family protein